MINIIQFLLGLGPPPKAERRQLKTLIWAMAIVVVFIGLLIAVARR